MHVYRYKLQILGIYEGDEMILGYHQNQCTLYLAHNEAREREREGLSPPIFKSVG